MKALVVVIAAAIVSACVFKKLDEDLAQLQAAAHLYQGHVESTDSNAKLIVVALADPKGEQIIGFRLPNAAGDFVLRTEPTDLYLFAFEDRNQDLAFQAGEPYGWANKGEQISAQLSEQQRFTINLGQQADKPLPASLQNLNLLNHVQVTVNFNLGTVTSLSDPRFSDAQAKKGLWQPFAFMQDGSTGIHFEQPYDPKREPILLVHGINGHPGNFRSVIAAVDRNRYQVWYISYPSGLGLNKLAAGSFQMMEMLHRQYRFKRLHLVAHSMGGLVSRGAINLCSQQQRCDYLASYSSISTPWAGVESAKSGVKWAPSVVPVWRDIAADSDFISRLFDTPLPDNLPFQLLFGFRQSGLLGGDSSDGVIKLSSQLREQAQNQASTQHGFDEDHMSILQNRRVMEKLAEHMQR